MPDKPRVSGYIWNSEIKRALSANRHARNAATRIMQLTGTNSELNRYLTQLVLAVAEEQDALNKLKEIANGHKE